MKQEYILSTISNFLNNVCSKKLYTLLCISIFTFTIGKAQSPLQCKSSYNWHFGNKAAVAFNGNSPLPATVNNGQITPFFMGEGCASASDVNGNLLFYTNGTKVWDASNTTMQNGNGLAGNGQYSAAQAALIVPKPLSNNIYYIFTVKDWATGPNFAGVGLDYSIVNMNNVGNGTNLNPLGNVTNKNVPVNHHVKEQVTAVYHSNCKDIWIISHETNLNKYVAYLLTDAGLQTNPVISNIGMQYPGSNRFGGLKPSHDGKKLCTTLGAWSTCQGRTVEVLDFDNTTGAISNPITIADNGSIGNAYSSEFSHDNSILYVVAYNGSFIYQYDLSSGNQATIVASKTNIASGNATKSCLQMGPDKKIYVSRNNTHYLGVISNPNSLNNPNYIDLAVNLGGGSARMGLPYYLDILYNETQANVTICQGDSIYLGGSYQTVTNTFIDTLVGNTICDPCVDIRTTNLTVLPRKFSSGSPTICNGQSISVGGSTYSTSGTYTDVFTANNGCDSTVTTNLTVLPNKFSSASPIICNGQSISVGGNTYSTSGTYTDVFTANNGCDSTVTTSLTVLPNKFSSAAPTICNGQSISIGGNTYSTSGTYTDVFTANNGCDSTVTTSLTVLPNKFSSASPTICNGQSISVGGNTYSTSGTYIDVFTANNGCDSTVTTSLTVVPNKFSSASPTICDGQSISVGGNTYSTSGTYTDVFTANNGCDSTVTTSLTVLPNKFSSASPIICDGQSITVGGSTYSTSGTYTDLFTANNGCDSTVTTNLTVLPRITTTSSVSICYGQHITVGSNTYSNTGTYTDVFTALNGCDSIVTTNLTVLPFSASSSSISICNGENVIIGSNTYTTTGSYTDIFTAYNGCDSIVTTILTVLPLSASTSSISICNGENITVGVHTYYTSGTYTDIFTAVNGCDSTVTTNLTVLPLASSYSSPSICNGESITIGSNSYSATGTYIDIFTAANGCDSTVTTELTVMPLSYSTNNVSLCDGQSIVVDGNTYTTSGIFTNIFTAANGCDSIVTTNLTILPNSYTTNTLSICNGESHNVGSNSYNSTGNYVDVFTSANGCDSTVFTNLTVLSNTSSFVEMDICEGDSVLAQGSYQTATGTYYDTLVAANGCDSVIITSLNTVSVTVEIDGENEIFNCQDITLSASGASTYIWNTEATSSSITINPIGSTTYTVVGTNSMGCQATESIDVNVSDELNVYLPNVFSPSSNNPDNQKLFIFGTCVDSLQLTIYDRWGELVFESMDANSQLTGEMECCIFGNGWDGSFNNSGEKLNSTTFAYILKGKYRNGKEFFKTGNLTLK